MNISFIVKVYSRLAVLVRTDHIPTFVGKPTSLRRAELPGFLKMLAARDAASGQQWGTVAVDLLDDFRG